MTGQRWRGDHIADPSRYLPIGKANPMSNGSASRVNPRKYPTAKEAQEAAMMEAASTAGLLLPAVMFRQGQRVMLATALPMPHVRRRLQVNSAPARGGVDEVRGMTNR